MKEILLGIPSKWAEMTFGKALQTFQGGAALFEIEVPESFHDPDIDGKGGGETVGKKQDAIGDFAAHPGQLEEELAGGWEIQMVESGWIELTGSDSLSRLEKVGRPESHFAGAQFSFGALTEAEGGGKGEGWRCAIRDGNLLAVLGAEKLDDLLDLDDLLGRGENKRRETFPGRLAEQTQSTAGLGGYLHRSIIWKRGEDPGEIDVRLEVMAEPVPVAGWRGCFGGDTRGNRMQADPMLTNDTFPGIVVEAPAKGLARTKRCLQVIIASSAEDVAVGRLCQLDGSRFRHS